MPKPVCALMLKTWRFPNALVVNFRGPRLREKGWRGLGGAHTEEQDSASSKVSTNVSGRAQQCIMMGQDTHRIPV